MIQEIENIASQFRILKDWEFGFAPDANYKGQCTVLIDNKHCLIYGWPEDRPMPEDYLLHEVLHAALTAFKQADDREVEEQFVQDLCKMMTATT